MRIDDLLMLAKERGASDLHINVGSRPAMRIHNELVRMEDQERLTPDDTKELLFSLMNDSQVEKLQQTGECDFSFGRPQIGRFRVNVYRQRGTYAAAIRIMFITFIMFIVSCPSGSFFMASVIWRRIPDTTKRKRTRKHGFRVL